MNLYRLRYFLSVAKHLNFTKAAQENFVAQPVISRAIIELENEIGCKLFVRSKQGVYLTAAGNFLVPIVEEILQTLQDAFEIACNLQNDTNASIMIAALTPATQNFLPHLINEYCEKNTNTNISVSRLLPNEMCIAMDSNKYDLYFSLYNDLHARTNFQYRLVQRDELSRRRFIVHQSAYPKLYQKERNCSPRNY